tara:strand:- start:587 stop:1369 length:783 start_codon:yes stop_codon:yes gene_type:complete
MVRGLKSLITKTSPGKLVKARKYTCYRATTEAGRPRGAKLRGVARLLEDHVFSDGELPQQTDGGPSGYAGGKFWGGNGLKRGAAVDAQVTKLAKASASARLGARKLQLTSNVFDALAYHKLEPIEAQRVVLDERRRLATAVDIVCVNKERSDELVLVELKTGYRGDRSAPVRGLRGAVIKMKAPLGKANDCALHRHLSQLSATRELFVREAATMKALHVKGITRVVGMLLYITPAASEVHALPAWWSRRGERLLDRLAAS